MQKNKNVGPIIGFLVVAIIIIVVALYLFASHINRQPFSNLNTRDITSGRSNDLQTLKNDLNNAIK